MAPSEQVVAIQAEGWLTIEDDDMTIQEAITLLERLGNVILGVEGRRIKVLDIFIDQEAGEWNGTTG